MCVCVCVCVCSGWQLLSSDGQILDPPVAEVVIELFSLVCGDSDLSGCVRD